MNMLCCACIARVHFQLHMVEMLIYNFKTAKWLQVGSGNVTTEHSEEDGFCLYFDAASPSVKVHSARIESNYFDHWTFCVYFSWNSQCINYLCSVQLLTKLRTHQNKPGLFVPSSLTSFLFHLCLWSRSTKCGIHAHFLLKLKLFQLKCTCLYINSCQPWQILLLLVSFYWLYIQSQHV